MWDQIRNDLNFTYSTVLAPDGLWSFLYPNGTWKGLFGMLQRNDVDILLGIIWWIFNKLLQFLKTAFNIFLGPAYTVDRVRDFDPTIPVLSTP